MKRYFLDFGIVLGFLLLFSSIIIVPISLVNDYLIYSLIPIIGLVFASLYIYYNRDKVISRNEYMFITLRSIFSFGFIFVFLFLWINFYWRDRNDVIVETSVKNYYLDTLLLSKRIKIRSAFTINYKGQTKNIIWNSRLDDSIMHKVNAIEIKKNKGLFGIDIIIDTTIVYKQNVIKYK